MTTPPPPRRPALALWAVLLILLAACGAPAGPLGPTRAGGMPATTGSAAAEPAKGDPNAPVTLVEYGDYQ